MAASTTTKKTSSPPPSVNKDLSCLRCRKKKAKCSKTRPTCTRCARSNQPCEYPDAPPNLADLSQKVLTLYDSLRELEGEFLERCLGSDTTSPRSEDPIETSKQDELFTPSTQEPAGWSMSFTETGLSMHVVARNGYEWNEFSKSLSRQLNRGFGPNYLPARWDPDAEGYYEAEGQAEELEEDEYLVTVPVFSAQSLLLSPLEEEQLPTASTPPVSLELLQVHLPEMIQHLKERFLWLETEQASASLHLAMLMRQFKLYLPLSIDASHYRPDIDKVNDVLSFIFILIAYLVSICLLPPLPDAVYPPLPAHVWYDCNEYATRLLGELMLAQGDRLASFPIVLCITLIAWIDHELVSRTHSKIKTTVLLQMAIRLALLSNWTQHDPWQLLIASFIHLDVYATIFYSQPSQLPSSLLNLIWKPSDTNGVLLEAKSMLFLTKVISLFYHDHDIAITRKVDVDDVLTLVRDIERFEQELPPWACWEANHQDFSRAKIRFHLIHHMTKILLFRPFCTNANEGQDFEQTFTKATFLDLSIAAADRLSICLSQLSKDHCRDLWFSASILMIKDVSRRAYLMFSEDREVNAKLTLIRERISCLDKQE